MRARQAARVKPILWWFGWRLPAAIWLGFLLLFFTCVKLDLFAFVVAAIPLVLWFVGTRHVNRHYERLVQEACAEVTRDGEARLSMVGPRGAPVLLMLPTGTAASVRAARRYVFAVLAVGEHSVGILEGVAFDLRRNVRDGVGTTREFYLDHLANVDAMNGSLVFTMTNGQQLGLRATFGVEQAVEQIRNRLRARHAHGAGASAASGEVVVQHVVERQVVVTRCKFCGQLTPVDLTACKSCGAQMGGL